MKDEHEKADCLCVTCERWFHHLGIASHRAMHRRREEDCFIEYSDGRIGRHLYAREAAAKRFTKAQEGSE